MTKGGFGKEGDNMGAFSVGDSKDDEVEVELTFYESKLYVNFLRGGRLDITGQGNASKILATVMEMVKRFVASALVEEVIIIVEEDGGSGARARIYRTLMKRYADRLGYDTFEKGVGAPASNDKSRPRDSRTLWFSLVRRG